MPQSTDTIKKCRIVILLAFKVNAKDIGAIHQSDHLVSNLKDSANQCFYNFEFTSRERFF